MGLTIKSRRRRIAAACVAFILLQSPAVWGGTPYEDLVLEHPDLIERRNRTVRIMVVGDLMMHLPIVNATSRAGGFDFERIFEPVAGLIGVADLVVGNLETTLTEDPGAYSGYPRFASPLELAKDLGAVGFDVLTTANNHALDTGTTGVVTTLTALDRAGIAHTGTSENGPSSGLIVKRRSVTIGLMAYTYGTNGLIEAFEGQVNRLDADRFASDHDALVSSGAVLTLAMVHWGEEYRDAPNAYQLRMEKALVDAGYDLVLGAHPHVVQPVSWTPRQFTAYSMGNFLSNQRGEFRDLGMIVDLVVEAKDEGPVIRRVDLIPTWVDKYQSGVVDYRIVPIEASEERFDPGERGYRQQMIQHFYEVVGEEYR